MAQNEVASVSEQPAVAPAAPLARRRVLIVDDNAPAASMLGLIVERLGNEVRTANDGRRAVEVASEFLPDLVLMDIGMPEMNGYQAARHIREQPWGREMVLIALTGWDQDEDQRRTKEAGFDRHLIKPIEPGNLRQVLNEAARALVR